MKDWQERFEVPLTAKCEEYGREWLNPAGFQFYLCQDSRGMWSVCNRDLDIPASHSYKRKSDCIRAFYKSDVTQEFFPYEKEKRKPPYGAPRI